MDLDLTGKIVLISGGSRGIGLAIAKLFLEEGCDVAIAARHEDDLTKAKVFLGGQTCTYLLDATDAASCQQLIDKIEKKWGRLDVLVTSAGSGASVPPGQETAAEWQRVMALNLFSATHMIAAATPVLAKSAPSSIVCISSIASLEVINDVPIAYTAAKTALNMTVKGLSRPLGRLGVRINAVSPGNIIFPQGTWEKKQEQNPSAVAKMLQAEVPLARFGTPELIANAVAFLASSRSNFTTGANWVIDGGQTRH